MPMSNIRLLMEEYLPNMERMLDSMSDYDDKEMQLRPLF